MLQRLGKYAPLGELLLRVTVGVVLCGHGWQKISGGMTFEGSVMRIGFPFPLFFAWCAALAEFLGGACIALGLFTRFAAFFAGFTMGVAVTSNITRPLIGGFDWPLTLLISCLFFFIAGGRQYSLDNLFFKKKQAM